MSLETAAPGRWKKPLLYAVMVVLAIPFVFPTWWMITSSLLPENEVLSYPPKLLPLHPQWSNYRTAFANYPLAHQYLNSLYIAVLVTAGTMVFSSLSGYAFARIPFPGRNRVQERGSDADDALGHRAQVFVQQAERNDLFRRFPGHPAVSSRGQETQERVAIRFQRLPTYARLFHNVPRICQRDFESVPLTQNMLNAAMQV